MADFLDTFINQLLHLDDIRYNRMLDVGDITGDITGGGDGGSAFRLFAPGGNSGKAMLNVIRARRGKSSNKTVLDGSALMASSMNSPGIEKWEWSDLNGTRDPAALDKYISDVYSTLNLKGNNPLFLSVGLLSWSVSYGKEVRRINTPLLIFPIRFVRGTNTTPVEIEFIDDDAYFNPCLMTKMATELSDGIYRSFPNPNGSADFDEPINLDLLGDGSEYMKKVEDYVEALRPSDGESVLAFDKDAVIIAQYNHSDMCMYYDVRRNKSKIYKSVLVNRMFGRGGELPVSADGMAEIYPVLPLDSFQTELLGKIAAGRSLIVKGPPGTGKTLTIANMIATLLAHGKKVMVASEKLAALSEVYAKLPEPLRSFVMLLDYETEKKAAEVNPATIRSQFKQLVTKRREYVYDTATDTKYQRALRARDEAESYLSSYNKVMFESDVAGMNLYDALNLYYKDENLPIIPFAEGDKAAGVSRDGYNGLLLRVKDGASHYAALAAGGSVYDSPWYGATRETNTEGAMRALSEIKEKMKSVLGALSPFVDMFTEIEWDSVSFSDIINGAAPLSLSLDEIKLAALGISDGDASELASLYAEFEAAEKACEIALPGGINEKSVDLLSCEGVSDLTVEELRLIAAHAELFESEGSDEANGRRAEKFAEAIDCITARIDERDALIPEVRYTFTHADDASFIVKYGKNITKYAGAGRDKPDALDFKAKSALKKLLPLCARTDVTLDELAASVNKQLRIIACNGDIEALLGTLAPIMGRKSISDEEKTCVLAAARTFRKSGLGIFDFVNMCIRACAAVDACLDAQTPQTDVSSISAGGEGKDAPDYSEIKVRDVENAIRAERAAGALRYAVNKLCGACAISPRDDFAAQVLSLVRVLTVRDGKAFGGDGKKAVTFITQMQRAGGGLSRTAEDVINSLSAFGDKYFKNVYSLSPLQTTVARIRVFIAQADDRSAINAAIGYADVKSDSGNALSLDAFFAPIERGEIDTPPEKFADLFVHSHIALAIEYKLSSLGVMRNGLCKNAEHMLDRFGAAENALYECNALKIEKMCMSRLNPGDDDFDFLQIDRGISMSLRKFFKKHARAILKLKPCVILSPSTASVLFRDELYEQFDAVIVDEASQIEPVDMLPVLFRSRQCVMVGDEYQMPPLFHFKAKNRMRIEDENNDLTVDPDISALSLAIGNLAFDTVELKCHYRSMTESLIEFSQRRFYKDMRTFPATVPATPDLGFEDVLTPDGCCDNGVNKTEAAAVVNALKAHFERHFDKKTHALKMSVGVVTFGEPQLKYVKNAVAKDAALSKMISDAYAAYDDVPDKLVFFRTIETVQGQETDHLILSVTYGRDATGKTVKSFGSLNRDAVGANIFNVAVTRARSLVTVIHSVTAQEISGNPHIDFICDYLACAKRYSEAGRGQFVSAPPERGENFIASVVQYLTECGIKKERIVTDYGVTLGSVRIPIAVLSPDLGHAELGVWCETPVLKKYDYYDYNVRYTASLKERGWTLHKVYVDDWYDNSAAEKKALGEAIRKLVTL